MPRDRLDPVAERVRDHPGGHGEQQQRANEGVVDHPGGGQGVHCVRGRVQARPSGADQAAGENAIGLFPLQPDTRDEQRPAGQESRQRAAGRRHAGERVGQEQGDANHQDQSADLVEQAAAHQRLPLLVPEQCAQALAERGARGFGRRAARRTRARVESGQARARGAGSTGAGGGSSLCSSRQTRWVNSAICCRFALHDDRESRTIGPPASR